MSRPRPEPTLGALDLPPRSRLYGLEPCGGATDWCECLTSYINRLGWAHGVAPRALALQEIGPLLDAGRWAAAAPGAMRGFCVVSAMSLNGLGDRAAAWATILERLTLSPDLQRLTAAAWLGAFPNPRLLRTSPAWCPACYQEWREQDRPIYQPLLWMFRVVTRCPRHDTPLRQRCPHCGATQVVIVAHAGRAGACTRCARWLGAPPPPPSASTPHGEDLPWQRWVVRVLGELRGMHGTPGLRRWDTAIAHLAAAMKHPGSHARLASVSGIDREVLYRWTAGSVAPSFELIMQFCYTCNTTPQQLMRGQVGSLERTLQDALAAHPIRQHRRATHRRLDRERCRAVILAILDGREPPLGPHQVAKQLGCAEQSLRRSFPKECTLLAQLVQARRQQQRQRRIAELVAQVRHEVEALHAQGIAPTSRRLGRILPPGTMRQPEASAAWRAALRDLGRRP